MKVDIPYFILSNHHMENILLQQLFESGSSTFTYLLADRYSREAVIIDPVLETVDRDLQLIRELDLNLRFILETHVHADHITGAGILSSATGAVIAISASAQVEGPVKALSDGDVICFGSIELRVIATPGHTNCCMCFVTEGKVFTGDTLLIRSCGRTDFQEGSAQKLFESIQKKLFILPDETVVYPAHDYKGFTSSTIGLEKCHNARINQGRELKDFIHILNNLNLPRPKKIDIALPANLKCGRI